MDEFILDVIQVNRGANIPSRKAKRKRIEGATIASENTNMVGIISDMHDSCLGRTIEPENTGGDLPPSPIRGVQLENQNAVVEVLVQQAPLSRPEKSEKAKELVASKKTTTEKRSTEGGEELGRNSGQFGNQNAKQGTGCQKTASPFNKREGLRSSVLVKGKGSSNSSTVLEQIQKILGPTGEQSSIQVGETILRGEERVAKMPISGLVTASKGCIQTLLAACNGFAAKLEEHEEICPRVKNRLQQIEKELEANRLMLKKANDDCASAINKHNDVAKRYNILKASTEGRFQELHNQRGKLEQKNRVLEKKVTDLLEVNRQHQKALEVMADEAAKDKRSCLLELTHRFNADARTQVKNAEEVGWDTGYEECKQKYCLPPSPPGTPSPEISNDMMPEKLTESSQKRVSIDIVLEKGSKNPLSNIGNVEQKAIGGLGVTPLKVKTSDEVAGDASGTSLIYEKTTIQEK